MSAIKGFTIQELSQEMLEKMVEDGHATKETKNVLVWVNMDSDPVQVMKLADVYTFK